MRLESGQVERSSSPVCCVEVHDSAISFQADYRLDGKEELICCSADGEVRGYLPASQETLQREGGARGPGVDVVAEQKRLEELNQMKQVCVVGGRGEEGREGGEGGGGEGRGGGEGGEERGGGRGGRGEEGKEGGGVRGPGVDMVAEQKRLEELNQMKQVCVVGGGGTPCAFVEKN